MKLYRLILSPTYIVRVWDFLCPNFVAITTNICLKILSIFVILIIEIILLVILVKSSDLAV